MTVDVNSLFSGLVFGAFLGLVWLYTRDFLKLNRRIDKLNKQVEILTACLALQQVGPQTVDGRVFKIVPLSTSD